MGNNEYKGKISLKRQCELLNISRSSQYYSPKKPLKEQMERESYIKERLDYWHTQYCYLGARRLRDKLRKEDNLIVGIKSIKRYLSEINIHTVYPKANLSKRGGNFIKMPYLLKNKKIFLPNQVWAIDITYIKLGKSNMYLTAIIDWYSRFVISTSLSDTLETSSVMQAVREGIDKYGVPAIINSDQGSQFTSKEYMDFLADNKIKQSMDGKARWVDNVIIERWFRSLKCEYLYINEFNNPRELRQGIANYVKEYNNSRPHSEHSGNYPVEVYKNTLPKVA